MITAQLNTVVRYEDLERLGTIISGAQPELEGNPVSNPGVFNGREGYDPDFIEGWPIALPKAVGVKAVDMLPLRGTQDVELKYMHFSVIMSKSRKLPMLTATNVNGGESKKLGRYDKWYLDGRIEAHQQWGNELYLNNRLDRGHMVRREDPVWGADAATANSDTFHYTNCCPQMDVFNQQTWLGLENYILQNARVNKLSISVFTGPFFGHNDMTYNGARIPNGYWKVVAFLKEDGTPSATAYKISQEKELTELEFAYGPYRTFQISIREVVDNTGIDFSSLERYDGFTQQELESASDGLKREIRDLNDILL